MQVVVVYAVLVVLEGDHGEGKGPHAAWAPVGQPHLQAYGVTHVAGRRFTVTRLSVHQHIYKRHRTQTQGHDPASLPTRPPVCPSPLLHPPRLPPPCVRLGAGTQIHGPGDVQVSRQAWGQSCNPEGLCHVGGAEKASGVLGVLGGPPSTSA